MLLNQPNLNGQDVPARESRAKVNVVQGNSFTDGVQIARDMLLCRLNIARC